jgi:hypothetical protein
VIVIVAGAVPFWTVTRGVVQVPLGKPSWEPDDPPPLQLPYVSDETLTVTERIAMLIVAVTLAVEAAEAAWPIAATSASVAAVAPQRRPKLLARRRGWWTRSRIRYPCVP